MRCNDVQADENVDNMNSNNYFIWLQANYRHREC